MTSTAHQSKHQRPRSAAALVRLVLSWLLVAVLAVDMVTSPLHAHHHDGEWSVGSALGASAEHPSDLLGLGSVGTPAHVDHDEAPGISHSISALRSPAEVKAGVPPSDESTAATPWWVPALRLPGGAAGTIWPPDRHRAGSSAFKSLPPHGRAPPLHG